ncbi:MAG: PHP domain-containing protein [Acidimicrobiales bacterium]|jgi:predicted metal-dependent phosphoesterase TrpH
MIDLHTHSTVSDGSDPPERIPELAAAAGCRAVALTDHDSLAGLGAARARAAELGITLVPGCEISCHFPGVGSAHVLCYFVEDDGGPLAEELILLRGDRRQRNLRLAARLEELGLPVTYADAVAEAGTEEGMGRPHFAAAMVKAGVAVDIQDAFDRFLSAGRPAYVRKSRLVPADVARLATASGGVAVLAHPFSLGLEGADLASAVEALAGWGFAGIEAVYGRYSPRQRQELGNLARRFGLVATGGSDYHGTIKPDLAVGTGRGDLKVPDKVLVELEGRRPAA